MAVTSTLTPGGNRAKKWTVVFGADGDTTATLLHGFGDAPALVIMTPTTPQAYVGQVHVSTIDNTQIVITKGNVVLSGGATVEVTAFRPGSIL